LSCLLFMEEINIGVEMGGKKSTNIEDI
jgi:hypothetical protein